MPDPQTQCERVQFPLRALFVFTVVAGFLAALTRWLIHMENAFPVLVSTSTGLVIGFVTVVILQNAQITHFLVTLLIGLVVCGLWFSGGFISYSSGVFIGAVIALKGLHMLNESFRICGLTVSVVRRPTDSASNAE